MNVNVNFKKIYNEYAKDKIEDLGYIKADYDTGKECIKGITYKLNYIDRGIREIQPAYCVSPENFYGGEIDKYLAKQNKHLEEYYGDDPEGLIICKKEKNKYTVKYDMGAMVTPYYPLLSNMTFTKVDTNFHNIINELWSELYLDEDMTAGIELKLDVGNGSGNGLLKDIINEYLQIDNKGIDKKLDKTINKFVELFEKYKITIPSLKRLSNISLNNISKGELKQAILKFIYDIDNLSINDEKLNLRDKETTMQPIQEELKKIKQLKKQERSSR